MSPAVARGLDSEEVAKLLDDAAAELSKAPQRHREGDGVGGAPWIPPEDATSEHGPEISDWDNDGRK